MNLALERQQGTFDAEAFGDTPVHCAGVGGGGSNIVRLLALSGVRNIHGWDGDTVAAHNVHNQFLPPESEYIGRPKVEALHDEIYRWTGVHITMHNEFIKGHRDLSGVVFLGVDNMEAALDIWETSICGNDKIELLINARMDATFTILYSLFPKNEMHQKMWRHFWHPSSESQNETMACGGRLSAALTSTRIATDAVLQFIRWHNQKLGRWKGPLYNMITENLKTLEKRREIW